MSTNSKEFAAVIATAVIAVAGWLYLISELATKLAYPSIV